MSGSLCPFCRIGETRWAGVRTIVGEWMRIYCTHCKRQTALHLAYALAVMEWRDMNDERRYGKRPLPKIDSAGAESSTGGGHGAVAGQLPVPENHE